MNRQSSSFAALPVILCGAGAVLYGAGAANAHHSVAAEFGNAEMFEIEGVVEKLFWTDPHIRVRIRITGGPLEEGEIWDAVSHAPRIAGQNLRAVSRRDRGGRYAAHLRPAEPVQRQPLLHAERVDQRRPGPAVVEVQNPAGQRGCRAAGTAGTCSARRKKPGGIRWQVENGNHYRRDATLGGDASPRPFAGTAIARTPPFKGSAK